VGVIGEDWWLGQIVPAGPTVLSVTRLINSRTRTVSPGAGRRPTRKAGVGQRMAAIPRVEARMPTPGICSNVSALDAGNWGTQHRIIVSNPAKKLLVFEIEKVRLPLSVSKQGRVSTSNIGPTKFHCRYAARRGPMWRTTIVFENDQPPRTSPRRFSGGGGARLFKSAAARDEAGKTFPRRFKDLAYGVAPQLLIVSSKRAGGAYDPWTSIGRTGPGRAGRHSNFGRQRPFGPRRLAWECCSRWCGKRFLRADGVAARAGPKFARMMGIEVAKARTNRHSSGWQCRGVASPKLLGKGLLGMNGPCL